MDSRFYFAPESWACIVCLHAYNECMQYTIRQVPRNLDEALRRAARERGKSLNEVTIEALARGLALPRNAAGSAISPTSRAHGAKIPHSIAP